MMQDQGVTGAEPVEAAVTIAVQPGGMLRLWPGWHRAALSALQVLEQLGAHLAQWSCHVAFPELAHLPLVQLRGFAKSCKVERFRTASCALADAIQRNAAWVAQRRDAVDFSPKDASQVAGFLRMEFESKQVRLIASEHGAQRRVHAAGTGWPLCSCV